MSMYFIFDYNDSLNLFYEDLKLADFSKITNDDIEYFKENSKELNLFYNNKYSELCKGMRYIKTLEKIKVNTKKVDISSPEKKFIYEMFIIDPDLEALMIREEFNKNADAKTAMRNYFGLYDEKLYLIEKEYLKIIDNKEKKVINEKILKRVFK